MRCYCPVKASYKVEFRPPIRRSHVEAVIKQLRVTNEARWLTTDSKNIWFPVVFNEPIAAYILGARLIKKQNNRIIDSKTRNKKVQSVKGKGSGKTDKAYQNLSLAVGPSDCQCQDCRKYLTAFCLKIRQEDGQIWLQIYYIHNLVSLKRRYAQEDSPSKAQFLRPYLLPRNLRGYCGPLVQDYGPSVIKRIHFVETLLSREFSDKGESP